MSEANSADKYPKPDPLKTTVIAGEQVNSTAVVQTLSPWTLDDLLSDEDARQKQQLAEQVETRVQASIQPELERQLKSQHQQVYDEAYQKGYEAGYKVGEQEGHDVGQSQAHAEVREFLFDKVQQFDSALNSLSHPFSELQSHLWQQLSSYAIFLAEQVIEREITNNKQWLQQIVEQSVKTLEESEEPLEVFLSQNDFEFLQQESPEFIEKWQIKPKETLNVGECDIKQHFSSVHVDWKQRFDALVEQVQAQQQDN